MFTSMVEYFLIRTLQALIFTISIANAVNPEVAALLLFNQSLRGDPGGALSNWNPSDGDPCSWNGILCANSSVVSISIPRKSLSGFLSPSLGSLSSLRHINLRNNHFSGALPPGLFRARGIQSLVLYGNSFSGELPKDLGNLRYLQTLDLSQNFFNGTIPREILLCKRLRAFDLHQNNLSGSLPDGFGVSFPDLEKLDLSFNGLDGVIPQDLGNLSRLRGTLDLSHNLFSGRIPPSLENLPEKVYIDLAFNDLSGEIPLTNRRASAFLGNLHLCGSPLKIPCSKTRQSSSKELTAKSLTIIIICDVIGICLCGALFSLCYSKVCAEKDQKKRIRSEDEYNDIVKLDPRVAFDLEDLLKASAFVLGKSDKGIVYKVILVEGVTLAVRRLGGGGSQRLKEFEKEVEPIGKIKHPNIAELRAYYWSIEEKLLIYDFIPNGNLSEALHGKSGAASFEALPWGSRLQIMKGIARGLVHLHGLKNGKYSHGDLSARNVLLDEKMEPRISDLGVARLADIVGSRSVRNSEGKRTQRMDIYSYGVILLEMISARDSEIDVVSWIHQSIEDQRPLLHVLDPHLRPDLDKEDEIITVLNIATSCVHPNPYKRPSISRVFYAFSTFS